MVIKLISLLPNDDIQNYYFDRRNKEIVTYVLISDSIISFNKLINGGTSHKNLEDG